MIRKDLKWFMIIMLATAVSFGTSNFIFFFLYNKLTIKGLFEDGYRVKEFAGISEDDLEEYLGVEAELFMFKPEPDMEER